ncbi:winged helix-turn-helix domain-containing protein [Shewanella nanhaiensis]|uniref:Winged helix-turn-helix domain-containing protein n=1 Tax=Shewanella nanhaiensis TaxID=2864872 RepID=A0ABS7E4X4_9GAMM|nr:winged helix-turn-helix domain-containing protein [Shewanella nanhaiensis]MBW8184077.1 winged helix-turn-helix domain-containing protein [Shewanella nanhaiensis]
MSNIKVCEILHCSLCDIKTCKLNNVGFSYKININTNDRSEFTKLNIKGKNESIACSNYIVRCLCILVENFEKPVSKDEISKFVWSGRMIGQNSVPVLINELRKILQGSKFKIVTLRGLGYILMGTVNE